MPEAERDDIKLIQLAGIITDFANNTTDPRILAILDHALKMIDDNALPTLLLQYHNLLQEERQTLPLQLEEEPSGVPIPRRPTDG